MRSSFRKFAAGILIVWMMFVLTSCDTGPSSEQVLSDFNRALGKDKYFEEMEISNRMISIADGWDDGVDIWVKFKAHCQAPLSVCDQRKFRMELHYRLNPGGAWESFASKTIETKSPDASQWVQSDNHPVRPERDGRWKTHRQNHEVLPSWNESRQSRP